jgi:hypothetical protein
MHYIRYYVSNVLPEERINLLTSAQLALQRFWNAKGQLDKQRLD